MVDSCNNDCTNHQEPIGKRYVYLAVEDFRGVYQLDLWEVGELCDLREELWSLLVSAYPEML